MKNEKKLNEKHSKQNGRKTRGSGAKCGTLPQETGNTIRSKIEDKLTEETLKNRENAAHANTPWAPSGPERIEVAYGKVPLWARGERMFAKLLVFKVVVSRET